MALAISVESCSSKTECGPVMTGELDSSQRFVEDLRNLFVSVIWLFVVVVMKDAESCVCT